MDDTDRTSTDTAPARRLWVMLAICGGFLALVPAPALAGSGGCSISTTPVSFGAYSTMDSTPLASTGTITYSCAQSAQAKTVLIWIDKGQHAPSNNPRQMASGADRLDYNLYLDGSHTAIWGDPNPNQYAFAPANGVSYDVTVYGLVPALQDLPTGTYTDTLVVTLNW
jgi:spore coat protein U-like protein